MQNIYQNSAPQIKRDWILATSKIEQKVAGEKWLRNLKRMLKGWGIKRNYWENTLPLAGKTTRNRLKKRRSSKKDWENSYEAWLLLNGQRKNVSHFIAWNDKLISLTLGRYIAFLFFWLDRDKNYLPNSLVRKIKHGQSSYFVYTFLNFMQFSIFKK